MGVIQPDDVFYRPDGSRLDIEAGDMLRVSYLDENVDPKFRRHPERGHTLMFQYLVRRIAYLDEAGRLVLTPSYYDLADRAAGPSSKTCCGRNKCGFFELDEVPENDRQTVSIF